MSLIRALNESDMIATARILDLFPNEVFCRDEEDRVALHYAAKAADPETFRRILEMDHSLIHCQDQNGHTPLLVASISGNVPAIKLMIENGIQINHVDKDKHSAVHWAVVCGQLEALVTLLESGAKVDCVDNQGAQAVHYVAATEGISLERCEAVLHILLRYGAKVNARDNDGRTPILWAVTHGNLEIAIMLFKCGGDIYAVDRDQLGAIHCAASHGHAHIIEYLINTLNQSIVNSVDRNGDTALFYAVTLGHYECARLLLLNGAEVNHQDRHLRRPVHCAAAKGQLRMIKLLKHFGGSCEIQNGRGDLPVHEAIQAGAKDCVEYLLLAHPSSVNVSNYEGRTGLHLAAASGNMEMVILLCTRDAIINPLMLYQGTLLTPLDLAVQKNHELIVEYLRLRQGAKLAEELSEDTRKQTKSHIKHQMVETGGTDKREDVVRSLSGGHVAVGGTESTLPVKSVCEETQTTIRAYRAVATNTSRPEFCNGSSILKTYPSAPTQQQQLLSKATSTAYLPRKQPQRECSESLKNVHYKNNEVEKVSDDYRTYGNRWTSEDDKKHLENENGKKGSILNESRNGCHPQLEESSSCGKISRGERMKKNVAQVRGIDEISATVGATAADGDDFKQTLEKSVGSLKVDIYRTELGEGESTTQQRIHKDKRIGRCYAHKEAIFNELTHLKKIQLQYGKVKEQILVRSLINNFCKMYSLNPARFTFNTFSEWEKFLCDHLSDQLKMLYLEERNYILLNSHHLNCSATSKCRTGSQPKQ